LSGEDPQFGGNVHRNPTGRRLNRRGTGYVVLPARNKAGR
jgi:hypothetical protein